MTLIQYALDNNLPVFGVCRGLQIMAHYFEYEISPCTGHAGTRHEISLSGNKRTVNSYHDNCGPLEINPPLITFVRDMEGHIEGFYHQDKPLMAVMWHPERELPVRDFDMEIIRRFFGLPL
ncbi:glutamine amidotransferase-related protein [Desulfonatronospira thiodismutans]|uniref:glutamine amidotransferase-related protein n=1 Tax=Desulfonatronospira thiodismutans TaxID=488939 RepID=UPI00067FD56D